MPMWMTKGRTIQRKGREKGKTVNNYRPVTCLPLVCKLLTGVIVKEKVMDFWIQICYYFINKKDAEENLG